MLARVGIVGGVTGRRLRSAPILFAHGGLLTIPGVPGRRVALLTGSGRGG